LGRSTQYAAATIAPQKVLSGSQTSLAPLFERVFEMSQG
jgi:hypothetical protein